MTKTRSSKGPGAVKTGTQHALSSQLERTVSELSQTRSRLQQLESEFAALSDENKKLKDEFRDLFEEAPIAYVHEGLDSRFIRANRAALALLGIKSEEVTDIFGKALVAESPQTQQRLQDAFNAIERGDERSAVELELHRKDNGKSIWVLWWSTPSRDGQYTRTMMVDVTDRVLIEQTKVALEFSLESGQVGDWDLDLIHDTSRRSLRHDQCFGYSEPIPESQWGFEVFRQHLHPSDREHVETTFNQAVEAGTYWSCDFRVIWRDRSVHWLSARGKVFGREGGRATRMLGIVMDITERKKAEEELRKAEETVRATKQALDFALEAGCIGDWDLDLIHDTSRRSLRHDQCFGYTEPIPEAQWGFKEFNRHVHPEDRALVQTTFGQAAAALTRWECEFRVIWPDQSEHWLAARGSIYGLADGKAARMLGVVMDITQRKRAEQALRASEQLSRGQVDALKGTLDVLAMEKTPEQLVGHILRITEQFGAHSSSVWCYEPANERIALAFAFEDGQFLTSADARFAGLDLSLPMEDIWSWPEVIRAGKPSLIEDIRDVPPFALRERLLPLGIVAVLLIPMSAGGQLKGAIGLRFVQARTFRDAEMQLAQALANQAMLMLELSRLSLEGREAAVVAERNRIARDVHDTIAQGLTGVIVQLEAAADATSKGLPSEARGHLERAGDLARESLREARRSVKALRPQVLQNVDLSTAMSELAAKMIQGTNLRAHFTLSGTVFALPTEWEDNLLRIGQEVVTNALRHALASELRIELTFAPAQITLQITDNGRGFDVAAPRDGFGLVGMRERADSMGGRMSIRSATGHGTSIRIVLPVSATSTVSPA
jgi:PAS domain S-box-containing protein